MISRLQYITTGSTPETIQTEVAQVLKGGGRWIQLRMKDADLDTYKATAALIRPMCTEVKATFVLNDHAPLVMALEADGVHLGKEDMSPDKARFMLGPDKIIGGTANTLEDIRRIERSVHYIGLGPYQHTETKKDLAPILGKDGYQAILSEGVPVAVFAIGGVGLDDLTELSGTGIYGVAVASAISQAADPTQETARFVSALSTFKTNE